MPVSLYQFMQTELIETNAHQITNSLGATQETFECEVAALEGSNGAMANGNGAGFKAFGKTYRSEHDAVVSFMKRNLRRDVSIEAIPQGRGEPSEGVETSTLAQNQIDQVNRRTELRDRPELIVRKCQ